MPMLAGHELSGLAETLLIPLAFRALAATEPRPIVLDRTAGAIVDKLGLDPSRFKRLGIDRVFTMMRARMRAREFDRCAREFLKDHPSGVVVEIGCGLDDRLSRVDNSRVEYYEMDLPEVMAMRARLFGERSRGGAIAGSVLEAAWLGQVKLASDKAYLILAEGVLPYFHEHQVKDLVFRLRDRYPGCLLVFDVLSPFMVWFEKLGSGPKQAANQLHWALRQDSHLERWGDGIRLLGSWNYFSEREPRLRRAEWMRYFPPLARGARVVRYRLGGGG